jgi:hypothetical protein
MKTSGELTGNFWSNEFGWFNCSSSDVGASNVQIWNPGNATSTPSPASSQDTGGDGGGGGRRTPGATVSTPFPSSSASSSSSAGTLDGLPARRGYLLMTVDGHEVLFRDVPVAAWFAPYVRILVERGIAQGYRDSEGNLTGLFGPANPVTHAEILKMALAAAGTPLSPGVPRNRFARADWSAAYVKTAEDLGLSVYGPSLDVRLPATRAQVVQTILEVFHVETTQGDNPFSDLPDSSPFAPAVETAHALGLIGGDTDAEGNPKGTVRPDGFINRAEVSKMVARLLGWEARNAKQ